MNRRAFLLGCIASPIAAKVEGVSAAPRPAADVIPMISPDEFAIELFKGKQRCIKPSMLENFHLTNTQWRLLNSGHSVELSAAARPA